MKHYNYQQRLHQLWNKAVEQYQAGQRGSKSYFTDEEAAWLQANGITPQEIYDFAEDFVSGGEPDFSTFAMITDVRRSHFLDKLDGRPGTIKRDPATYPPKDSSIDGIGWLPRILEKAKDKLRGELNEDTMYGCGGDRKFLKEHDIHPAEFLRKVDAHIDDDQAVIDWVKKRSANKISS